MLMQMRPTFHKARGSRRADCEAGWPGEGGVSALKTRFSWSVCHFTYFLGGWQPAPRWGEFWGLPGVRRSQEAEDRGCQGAVGALPASFVIRRISLALREHWADGKWLTTNKTMKCNWLSVGKYKRFNHSANLFDSDPHLIEIICCSVKVNPIVLL